jgi:hypothetical protein
MYPNWVRKVIVSSLMPFSIGMVPRFVRRLVSFEMVLLLLLVVVLTARIRLLVE